jgi:hypothetical protein
MSWVLLRSENTANNAKSTTNLEDLGVLASESKGKEVIYVNTALYELLKKGS